MENTKLNEAIHPLDEKSEFMQGIKDLPFDQKIEAINKQFPVTSIVEKINQEHRNSNTLAFELRNKSIYKEFDKIEKIEIIVKDVAPSTGTILYSKDEYKDEIKTNIIPNQQIFFHYINGMSPEKADMINFIYQDRNKGYKVYPSSRTEKVDNKVLEDLSNLHKTIPVPGINTYKTGEAKKFMEDMTTLATVMKIEQDITKDLVKNIDLYRENLDKKELKMKVLMQAYILEDLKINKLAKLGDIGLPSKDKAIIQMFVHESKKHFEDYKGDISFNSDDLKPRSERGKENSR